MRAIAAFIVVAMHAILGQAKGHPDSALLQALRGPALFGNAGVDIFFVISGFVIVTVARAAAKDASPGLNPSLAATFVIRRAARIYPLYWVTLLAIAALGGAASWQALATHPLGILLLRGPRGLHPVAWTLVFEVYFYAVVAVALFFSARRFLLAMALWAGVEIILITLGVSGTVGRALIYEFIFGGALAVAFESGRLRHFEIVLSIGLLGFAAAFFFVPLDRLFGASLWRVFSLGLPACLTLYGLIGIERQRGLRLPEWLQRRGAESYSLYLWHLPVMGLIGRLVPDLGSAWGIWMAAASIALSLVVAHWSYRIIERPIVAAAHGEAWRRKTQEPG